MSLKFKRHFKLLALLASFSLLSAVVLPMLACGAGADLVSTLLQASGNRLAAEATATVPAAHPAASTDASTTSAAANSPAEATAETAVTGQGSAASSVTQASLENRQPHDSPQVALGGGAETVVIALNGDSIMVDSSAVIVDGSTAAITSAGTYSLSGSLSDGQIVVDTEDNDPVTLILNGIDIHSSTSAPIYVISAKETVVVLADGTENHVSDSDSYVLADPEEDEPNAAIFSKGDLTFQGSGSLTVDGNYNDGIASKDGLVLASGTITVCSVDDGIRGKDYLVVRDGRITVTAQGDGLKSDNEEDPSRGYILIESGRIEITAGGDAIQAQTDVMIGDGEIILSSGGGSRSRVDADTSAKGIKAAVNVTIDGGTFTIDSADDAIHSNDSLVINGGVYLIATGDDGMHADATLEINGGDIRITESFEGTESAVITINAGTIQIVSSDDGLNVAGGRDASGTDLGFGPGGFPGQGGRPGRGGGPGQDAFAYAGDYYLYIHGGTIVIDAQGDGIDANGAIEMTDGVVVVHGPTMQMNGALDYQASFKISGGFLVAVGSSGMAQAPDASSTQHSVLLNFDGTLQAGTLLHLRTSDGTEILTFASTKPFQSIAFSSPELENGMTLQVYYRGSSTGSVKDGLYQGGTYSPGSEAGSFAISSIVTQLGGRSRW
jgi:hypothetical protein